VGGGVAVECCRPPANPSFVRRLQKKAWRRPGATAGVAGAIVSTHLALNLVVANERRLRPERRQRERRHFPGEALDVTRVEHENLFHVVEQLIQKVRILERDVRDHRDRLDNIETALGGRPPRIVKGW
jgi:hypothetical protein